MTERSPTGDLAFVRQLWLSDGRRLIGRSFKWLLAIGTVGVIVSTGIGAWRFSDLLNSEVFAVPDTPVAFDQATVTAVGLDSITLRRGPGATDALTRGATLGIWWSGGYGTVGEVLAESGDLVTRAFSRSVGEPMEGQAVNVDGVVYYGDPLSDRGIEYEAVNLRRGVDPMQSWLVVGDPTTWTIFVHGRGADRTEALRMLPAVTELGHTALMIRYRNDPSAQSTGRYGFGATEWADLEQAVQYAVERGAEQVNLVGYSMGGAIVAQFLDESPFADRVGGVVLDAPMLDLGRVIDIQSEARSIPDPLVSLAKTATALRFGVTWSELEYIPKLVAADVPILLFHGTEDDMVPVALSRELADLGEQVTYYEAVGAGHVQAWNLDPSTYELRVSTFLSGIPAPGNDDDPEADETTDA